MTVGLPGRAAAWALVGIGAILSPAPAHSQISASRPQACVSASAQITALRLISLALARKAVEIGRRVEATCKNDDIYLLGYSLARIEASKDVKHIPLQQRTAMFNAAVDDLERLKGLVTARRSDRYFVFGALASIYYDTQQYERSLAVLDQANPFMQRITVAQKRDMHFTRGMAQMKLGRSVEAAAAFGEAREAGHPKAAAWQQKMKRMQ